MPHLAGRVGSIGAADYFHIAGWRVTAAQRLFPSAADSPTFLDQMVTLINRGVAVRAMLRSFPGSVSNFMANHARDSVRFAIIIPGAGYLSNCQFSS